MGDHRKPKKSLSLVTSKAKVQKTCTFTISIKYDSCARNYNNVLAISFSSSRLIATDFFVMIETLRELKNSVGNIYCCGFFFG